MYLVVISSKTAFFKLQDIFPECFFYRETSPKIEPLICLRENNSCHVGKNCMETLAKRIQTIFTHVVPSSKLVILYFKKRNVNGLGAGIFSSDFNRVRVITMNPTGWNAVKNRGLIYEFSPTKDFFLTGKSEPIKKV